MRLTFCALTITSLILVACKPDGGDTGESGASTGGGATDSASSGATEPTTGAESSSASGSASVVSAETGDPSGDSSSSDPGTDTSGSSTTLDPAETGLADGCDSLDAEQCKQDPDCMPVIGQAEAFAGCMPGQQFLGCIDNIGCDDVLLTVCKDGTDESYRLPSGCFPEGFTPCDGLGMQCAGGVQCAGLGEDACEAQGCKPVLGVPHIVKDGMMCEDFENPEFLVCIEDIECPPNFGTFCKQGTQEPVWTVTTGCKLPGFEACGLQQPKCM